MNVLYGLCAAFKLLFIFLVIAATLFAFCLGMIIGSLFL